MKYKDSGVNIDKAARAKKAILEHVKSTWNSRVLSAPGAFGGMFSLAGHTDPVLVSSVDGVGTKLMVAKLARRFDTVGQDIVNHCVNDILVQGARPIFFLDYIASGSLDPAVIESLVAGISLACRAHGCALIGGETAEMPDLYRGDDFDLAGCIVGVVDKNRIVDGSTVSPGDRVLGLASNGLHTNGYSLARKIVFEMLGLGVNDRVPELDRSIGDALLEVHLSYLDAFTALSKVVRVKALAHITGGGLRDNFERVMPPKCDAVIRKSAWRVPPIFEFLQRSGNVEEEEMFHVFNMGVGMVVVVGAEDEKPALAALEGRTIAFSIGEIVEGSGKVTLE